MKYLFRFTSFLIFCLNECICRQLYCDLLLNQMNINLGDIQVYSHWTTKDGKEIKRVLKIFRRDLGIEWEFDLVLDKNGKPFDIKFSENYKTDNTSGALNRFTFIRIFDSSTHQLTTHNYECIVRYQVIINFDLHLYSK